MSNDLTKFLESKDNEIITDTFVIKDNLLKFDNLTLQLSNISRLYAGKKKLQIPVIAIIIFLISFMSVFVQPFIGLVGLILSGWYIFAVYQAYSSGKLYLSFNLNSGTHYFIYFKNKEFLEEVRSKVEMAFNKQHIEYSINVAEQKIINGDHHVINSNYGNINSGIQKDIQVNTDSRASYVDDHSSFSVGDIQNSSIQSSVIGNKNNSQITSSSDYDWHSIGLALQTVISAITIESPVKQASKEALSAVEKKDKNLFESIVKKYKGEFLSDLFQNTASGLLVQAIATVLGM